MAARADRAAAARVQAARGAAAQQGSRRARARCCSNAWDYRFDPAHEPDRHAHLATAQARSTKVSHTTLLHTLRGSRLPALRGAVKAPLFDRRVSAALAALAARRSCCWRVRNGVPVARLARRSRASTARSRPQSRRRSRCSTPIDREEGPHRARARGAHTGCASWATRQVLLLIAADGKRIVGNLDEVPSQVTDSGAWRRLRAER